MRVEHRRVAHQLSSIVEIRMSVLSGVSRSEHCLMHDTAQRRSAPKHNNTQPYTATHSTTNHAPAFSPSMCGYLIHAGLGAQVLGVQHHSQDACVGRVDSQHDCRAGHGHTPQLNRAHCSTAPQTTKHRSTAPHGSWAAHVQGCGLCP